MTQHLDKLQTLAEIEGVSAEQLIEDAGMDRTRAGICINPGCDMTDDNVDSDGASLCEECGTDTIYSVFMLLDMI